MSNPDSALERCTEGVNHPRVTVKAHGRSATFLNPGRSKIKKVDVDCWLGAASTRKADYVVCMPGTVDIIVELKGKDVLYAVEQVLATHARWRSMLSCANKIGALIVFTRSPQRSTVHDAIKAKLLTKHRIWLEMGKSGLMDYRFEIFMGRK
jgi:hypothetical protein